ncbi:MAG: hypothetical protein J6Z00_00275 [Clostridia bacterium]|nr:hypothetical protein [Clostridia bacterium]
MRKYKTDHGFLLCFIVNLILNFEWSIPAWILLVMHFVLHWPLWLFFVALGGWILYILIVTSVISWVASCGNDPKPHKENANPYSKKGNPYKEVE